MAPVRNRNIRRNQFDYIKPSPRLSFLLELISRCHKHVQVKKNREMSVMEDSAIQIEKHSSYR